MRVSLSACLRVSRRLLLVAALISGQVICIVEPPRSEAVETIRKRRRIRLSDLEPGLSRTIDLRPTFRSEIELQQYLDELERSTAKRISEGEFEHLIYYLLQSRYFTSLEPIEPALSARELFESLAPAARELLLNSGDPLRGEADRAQAAELARIRLPDAVRQRFAAFLTASPRPDPSAMRSAGQSERWRYFSKLIRTGSLAPAELLRTEYLRTMRFLYRKEFLSLQVARDAQAEYISGLYRTRAHSTDTQIEAGFGVDTALALIRQVEKERRFARVLIVGPGQDLAPRTGLLDHLAPQSFQPFTLLDSLRRHGMDDPRGLEVHCIDINPRVIAHLDGLAGRSVRLDLVSGLTTRLGWRFSEDFQDYFLHLGRHLGRLAGPVVERRTLPLLEGHLTRQVEVPPALTKRLTAARLNIIAERYEPRSASVQAVDQPFDLVVVTNVFPYFEVGRELPLAIANLAAMMSADGWLVHNEFSIIGHSVFNAVNLPVRQLRTLMIANGQNGPLYDGVVIHRRT